MIRIAAELLVIDFPSQVHYQHAQIEGQQPSNRCAQMPSIFSFPFHPSGRDFTDIMRMVTEIEK